MSFRPPSGGASKKIPTTTTPGKATTPKPKPGSKPSPNTVTKPSPMVGGATHKGIIFVEDGEAAPPGGSQCLKDSSPVGYDENGSCFSKVIPEGVIGIMCQYCAPPTVWALRSTNVVLAKKVTVACEDLYIPLLFSQKNFTLVFKYFYGSNILLECGVTHPMTLSRNNNKFDVGCVSLQRWKVAIADILVSTPDFPLDTMKPEDHQRWENIRKGELLEKMKDEPKEKAGHDGQGEDEVYELDEIDDGLTPLRCVRGTGGKGAALQKKETEKNSSDDGDKQSPPPGTFQRKSPPDTIVVPSLRKAKLDSLSHSLVFWYGTIPGETVELRGFFEKIATSQHVEKKEAPMRKSPPPEPDMVSSRSSGERKPTTSSTSARPNSASVVKKRVPTFSPSFPVHYLRLPSEYYVDVETITLRGALSLAGHGYGFPGGGHLFGRRAGALGVKSKRNTPAAGSLGSDPVDSDSTSEGCEETPHPFGEGWGELEGEEENRIPSEEDDGVGDFVGRERRDAQEPQPEPSRLDDPPVLPNETVTTTTTTTTTAGGQTAEAEAPPTEYTQAVSRHVSARQVAVEAEIVEKAKWAVRRLLLVCFADKTLRTGASPQNSFTSISEVTALYGTPALQHYTSGVHGQCPEKFRSDCPLFSAHVDSLAGSPILLASSEKYTIPWNSVVKFTSVDWKKTLMKHIRKGFMVDKDVNSSSVSSKLLRRLAESSVPLALSAEALSSIQGEKVWIAGKAMSRQLQQSSSSVSRAAERERDGVSGVCQCSDDQWIPATSGIDRDCEFWNPSKVLHCKRSTFYKEVVQGDTYSRLVEDGIISPEGTMPRDRTMPFDTPVLNIGNAHSYTKERFNRVPTQPSSAAGSEDGSGSFMWDFMLRGYRYWLVQATDVNGEQGWIQFYQQEGMTVFLPPTVRYWTWAGDEFFSISRCFCLKE